MKRQDAIRILRDALPRLKASYGVLDLGLFGSVARDEARPDSDVDIVVSLDAQVDLFGVVRLKLELEDLLGSKVDLGTWESLNPKLRSYVERDIIHVA
jgi:hypothetical protein